MAKSKSKVLCVDLDGTFSPIDCTMESSLSLLRKSPLLFFKFLLLLIFKGRPAAKVLLVKEISLRMDSLPVTPDLLSFLNTAKHNEGYEKIVLATGSNQVYADTVKAAYPVFDLAFGSSDSVNLTGKYKAKLLAEKFPSGFDYVGNSLVDLHVWPKSTRGYTANCSDALQKRMSKVTASGQHFGFVAEPKFKTLVSAVRVHQWPKNLLVVVPIFLGNKWLDLTAMSTSVLGFLCMCFLASSFYLINDLFDLRDDRIHPQKRERPLAAGKISVIQALMLSASLCLLGLGGGFFLENGFGTSLLIYAALTNAYTLEFKRVPLLDIFILASLFILRLVAGGILVNVYISHWLIVFSVFFFLSLALCKRFTEIQALEDKQVRRGYLKKDRDFILAMGVGSALMAALVISLYISSVNALGLYSQPEVLWGVNVILLFWSLRIWLITSRGEMNHDPVAFAVHDKLSLFCAVLIIFFWSEARLGYIMGSIF